VSGERSDEEQLSELIVNVAQTRDKASFAALFRNYAPRIKGFGLKMGRDAALAEELVQETMLAVWRSAHTYDPAKASATTWTFTICRNKRIDLYRARSRPEADPPGDDELYVAPAQDGQVEITSAFRRTQQYMKELPAEQAEVLRMSFLEDKSHGEIAAETGYPLGTVKSRIRLALASLRQRMEQ